jgi:hypothetical protein
VTGPGCIVVVKGCDIDGCLVNSFKDLPPILSEHDLHRGTKLSIEMLAPFGPDDTSPHTDEPKVISRLHAMQKPLSNVLMGSCNIQIINLLCKDIFFNRSFEFFSGSLDIFFRKSLWSCPLDINEFIVLLCIAVLDFGAIGYCLTVLMGFTKSFFLLCK